ncbi:hypothetical protein HY798_01490 [Candidatus Falkowbacteria bacterium]|nr:hypothetical protein [Candidatus Falkowbacteria bacterium]
MTKIKYPYLPPGREIKYAPLSNEFMDEAKKISEESICVKQPTAAVVVKKGMVIGRSSIAGVKTNYCPRWSSPTGKNYEFCTEICKKDYHAEESAVKNAKKNGHDTKGADLYLYGHWWCCKPCWDAMIAGGINNVYLLKNSWKLFNPEINKEMKKWGKPPHILKLCKK